MGDDVLPLESSAVSGFSVPELRKLYASMPKVTLSQHGCMNCEWRGTVKCVYGYKRGVPKDENDMFTGGICPKRLEYLGSFVTGLKSYSNDSSITYSQWQSAMLMMTAQNQYMREKDKMDVLWFDIQEIDDKISDITKKISLSTNDNEKKILGMQLNLYDQELKVKTDKYEKVREDWFNLMDKLGKHTGSAIDREMPKKIDINVNRTMTLEDRHRIMRGDVIDAEIIDGGDDNE